MTPIDIPTEIPRGDLCLFKNKPDDTDVVVEASAAAVSVSSDTESDNTNMNSDVNSNSNLQLQFPFKLYQMMEKDTKHVSWLPCGTAFQIHNKAKFCQDVLPEYFKSSNYKSFHRSLNLWGFATIRRGRYKAKYNPYFKRGRPDLCHYIKRTKLRRGQGNDMKTFAETTAPPSSFQMDLPPSPRMTSSPPVAESPLPATTRTWMASAADSSSCPPTQNSSILNPLLGAGLNPAALLSRAWDTTSPTLQQQFTLPPPRPKQSFSEEQQQSLARMSLFPHNHSPGMLTAASSSVGAGGVRDPMLLAAALEVLLCYL